MKIVEVEEPLFCSLDNMHRAAVNLSVCLELMPLLITAVREVETGFRYRTAYTDEGRTQLRPLMQGALTQLERDLTALQRHVEAIKAGWNAPPAALTTAVVESWQPLDPAHLPPEVREAAIRAARRAYEATTADADEADAADGADDDC